MPAEAYNQAGDKTCNFLFPVIVMCRPTYILLQIYLLVCVCAVSILDDVFQSLRRIQYINTYLLLQWMHLI